MTYIRNILAVAALAGPLYAQTESAENAANTAALPQLETTTVVTGTLWESELQNTTASVTVIDAESIRSSGTQHFGDLINSIPNLTWSATSSRPRYIQIRGIGENSQFEGETPDSSVRFLIDDLDLTGLGTVGNLFDVQQVEVLRGPQAGAFGANAAGGVVKIVTNQPTPYWTGQTEATVGDDSLVTGGFALGGPLLENDPEALTFRLSVHKLTQDGFRDNRFLELTDSNERDELTTRLKLRWIANEDWQFDGTLFYADANNGYDEWTLGNTEFDTYSDELGRDEQESFAASLRGKWTGLDRVEITSITSFTNTDSLNSFDTDWTNPTAPSGYTGFITNNRDRTRWSEEIRIDSIDQENALGSIDRWTAGIYFENFSEATHHDYVQDGSPETNYKTDFETSTFSLYGQGTHKISDKTRLTLGLRAEHYDLKTVVNYTELEHQDNPNFDEWLFGGKITLEHDVNDASMVFASITKGYKAGGANINPALATGGSTRYRTEDLWNYEVGARAEMLNNKLVSQLTLFYMDRFDAQLRSSTGSKGDFGYSTQNEGDARHFGAELEGTWFINENWSFSSGLGLLNTELDSTGDELTSAPDYTYNARLDFRTGSGFFANIEVTGSSDFYDSNDEDKRGEYYRSEFITYNTAIGYIYKNWKLTLWVKNLFDEEYEKRVFVFQNEAPWNDKRYENPADPQHFGVTLNYSW